MPPWTDLPFLAIDTETSGLRADSDRIIELAWARFEGGQVVDSEDQLLHFAGDLSPDITSLTSIDASALASQPPFVEVVPKLLKALQSVAFVVAYNAPFDEGFLRAECGRARVEFPSIPWVDTLVLARAHDAASQNREPDANMPHGWMRLTQVAERNGVELQGAHRALPDAVAAGELLLKFQHSLPQGSLDTLLKHQLDLRIADRKAWHSKRYRRS